MTEAELQSRVMGFADRFFAIQGQALLAYDAQSPPPGNRRIIVGNTAYILAKIIINYITTQRAQKVADIRS